MIRTFLIVSIIVAGTIGCEDARGSDLLTAAIERCRAIVDDIERLSCYDSIGESVPSADKQSAQIAEDFGLPDTTKGTEIFSVALNRCELAQNRFFYFYFENGQVWKYIGNKKLRYRNCPEKADVVEDGLGYKLRLQGETRWHRIQRMR